MGTQYLIDSNVVIDYLNSRLPLSGMDFMSNVVDNQANLSVITQIEVMRYIVRPDVHQIIAAFVDYCTVYPLSNDVVETTIKICQTRRIKLPDAIIAATAVYHGFTLLTRNIADFKNIAGMKYLNPWDV